MRAERATTATAGGYSLAEMLVATAVVGILATGVAGLLLGQGRLFEAHEEAVTARQDVRAAVDVMASELRFAGAGDVVRAEPDRLEVRFVLIRAVVCASEGRDAATIFVYDSVAAPNLPRGFRGVAVSDGEGFAYRDGWRGRVIGEGGEARAVCVGAGAPADRRPSAYRTLAGWSSLPGGSPRRGDLLRVYGLLTYRLDPARRSEGLALWRNRQELAAPFGGGSSFAYRTPSGVVPSVPAEKATAVREVHLRLSRPEAGERETHRYVVPLRGGPR